MKGRTALRCSLVLVSIVAVAFGADPGVNDPRPERERRETQTKEDDRATPPEVREARPAEPESRPLRVGREGPAEEPVLEPKVPETAVPSVHPPPNSAVSPVPTPPSPGRRAPEQGYRSNEPVRPYGGRGGYPSTFHGEHDRWRYDRYHGSWDFLIFPGPVIYAPPTYTPELRGSHVAGVYVQYSGRDVAGSSFAEAVDEQLRQNDMGPTASAGEASLELYIISMDEDPSTAGYGSAVSVSYILLPENRFITAQLLDVGSDQAVPLASSVVSYAAQLLDEYR